MAVALWPMRWGTATVLAATAMLSDLDPGCMPEELDRIEATIESVFHAYTPA